MTQPAANRPADPSPPRLYHDLVWLWPFVSPPEHYNHEAASFRARFTRHGVSDGAAVLHLGSGGGSIDWHLKQHYQVTGVDISDAMRAHAAGINPEVEYVAGDMRDVRLGRTFDAVLLHDAIAYMTRTDDLDAAYATAAAHLRPGGVLVSLPEQTREHFNPRQVEIETTTRDGITVTMLEFDDDPDPADHSYDSVFLFLIRDQGGTRVAADLHTMGIFTLDRFLEAARAAGFDVHVDPWEIPPEPGRVWPPLITGIRKPYPTPV